jgi:transcription elongation factor Elf1
MKTDETFITAKCQNCGSQRTFKLSDIIAEANLPSTETHLVHRISETCGGCDQRIELELTLELDELDDAAKA